MRKKLSVALLLVAALAVGVRAQNAGTVLTSASTAMGELSRRLLKLSGGSVDDYATFSTSVTSPSC